MMRISLVILILFFLIFGEACKGQEQIRFEPTPNQYNNSTLSFIIPNVEPQRIEVKDSEKVVAFSHINKGRILFTPSGAFIGISAPLNRSHPGCSRVQESRKEGDVEKPTETKSQVVVLKAGFSEDHASKCRINPRLEQPTKGAVNFLVGPEKNWRKNVSTYQKLVYDNVWNGIDLEYMSNMDHLALRFDIQPGANVANIVVETGAENVHILKNGDSQVSIGGVAYAMDKPFAFQNINGAIEEIAVQYIVKKGKNLGFKVGPYNRAERLTITHKLSWSTILAGPGGGSVREESRQVTVDNDGNVYLTGITPAADFPITSGQYNGGISDVFITKLNPEGTELLYSTFLGGSGDDDSYGISVDDSGNAYIAGFTLSMDFPTTNGAFDETYGGLGDVFVSKLGSDGSTLAYSTFIGGGDVEEGYGIAVDSFGHAFLTGRTSSPDFPVTPIAFDDSHNGGMDAFVIKFNANGSGLIYSSFVGGSGNESGRSIVIGLDGCAYVTGETSSEDFPTTSGAFDQTVDYIDAFALKIRQDGSDLDYSTVLGGGSGDFGYGIIVDDLGSAYVTGIVGSSDFPTTTGAYDEMHNGSYDVFVSMLNSEGSGLIYSTFLGGSSSDEGYGIALDASGNAFVTGYTESSDFPTTPGVIDNTFNGSSDVFIAKIGNDGSGLIYSTFLGGENFEIGYGIAVDPIGNCYVVGGTWSFDYPTSIDAFDDSFDGAYDVFVSKLNSSGEELIFSTLIGGESEYNVTRGIGMAIDTDGNTYVTGTTSSLLFPATVGAYSQINNGSNDVYITKLSKNGNTLEYSTYLGGSSSEIGYAVSVDDFGNAYVTGSTSSSDFPTTIGAYDRTRNGLDDVFVTKLNGDGESLVYSTYLGTSGQDRGYGIAVDSSGSAYLTGSTNRNSFPTTPGAYDNSYNGGSADAFISKLSGDGSELAFSTFLGGSEEDTGMAIELDPSGNVYVTGSTSSFDYPTTIGVFDETFNGDSDVFVCGLNISGSDLRFSTFLGGTMSDEGMGISVDQFGNSFVVGSTESTDYPTTIGVYDETHNGYSDLFVSKLDSDGNSLYYSTFIGGDDRDWGSGIAVDFSGNTYVIGTTGSADFPTSTGGFQRTLEGSRDAIFSKLNEDGQSLIYSTFIGGREGRGTEEGSSLEIDNSGNAYIVGTTSSNNFPTTEGAFYDGKGIYYGTFISHFLFFIDYNDDGCSNEDDFFFLLPLWNQPINPGNAISVLDFMWINYEGPTPCP